MSGLRLERGADYPDPDEQPTNHQVMFALQYPLHWHGLTDEQLADAVVNAAQNFLRAIHQAIKHEREAVKKDSTLHAPVSVIELGPGVDLVP